MIDIHFEINGKRIRPDQIGDALEQMVLKDIQESIKKKIGSIRCLEHGSAPKIICSGPSLDRLSFKVSGCCEKLIESVKEKLK